MTSAAFAPKGGALVPPTERPELLVEPASRRVLLPVREWAPEAPVRVFELTRSGVVPLASAYFAPHASGLVGQPFGFVGPGGLMLLALTHDALLVSPLDHPDRIRAYPCQREQRAASGGRAVFDQASGSTLVLLPGSNFGDLFRLEEEAVVSLGRAPLMLAMIDLPGAGVLGIGWSRSGHTKLHRFSGGVFVDLGELPLPMARAASWDPGTSSIALLRSFKTKQGQSELGLFSLGSGGVVEREDSARFPFASFPALAFGADGSIYYHVGLEGAGSLVPQGSFVVTAGEKVPRRLSAGFALPPAASYRSFAANDRGLWTVHHGSGEAWVYRPNGFEAGIPPIAARWDERSTQIAGAPDRLFSLVAGGEVFQSTPRGWSLLAERGEGPMGRYSHRTVFAHDPTTSSLLVFGGDERNDIWLRSLAGGSAKELDLDVRPPHGMGSAASTPSGVFIAMEDGTLWRFAYGSFTLVARDVPARRLVFDPTGPRLFAVGAESVGDHSPCTAYVLDVSGAAAHLARLPVPIGKTWSHLAELGFDVASRSLVLLAPGQCWSLELDRDLPEGLPLSSLDAPRRRRQPRSEWTRPAAALFPLEQPIDLALLPMAKGAEFLALLPRTPELELPEAGDAILLWCNTTSFSPAIEGEILPVWPEGLPRSPILAMQGRGPRRGSYQPFLDIDPAHRLEYDTPPELIERMMRGSKVGGFPTRIQDGAEPSGGRFLLQIGGDIFTWGDFGRALVYRVGGDDLEIVLETF